MLTKEFTPELQIFYILLKVFGLNVQVPVLELDKWNIFQEFGLNITFHFMDGNWVCYAVIT